MRQEGTEDEKNIEKRRDMGKERVEYNFTSVSKS